MYLIDREIVELLPQLNIETEQPDILFSVDDQIQPCSIDLRLSNVFWLSSGIKSTIDLRRSKLAEVSPRRHWKRIVLKPTESRTIKPGEILLGRTYEKFTIPPFCAAKLEGRSSFARMGLAVHCTGGFINPAWRGHMPLQLVNLGPHPIKVFPYIPICQLLLMRLSDAPERLYGHEKLQSKYMDDDGGPSYWWRDKRIASLQESFRSADANLAMQNNILHVMGGEEPEILERFERYVDKQQVGRIESAEALLDEFARSEDRGRRWDKVLRWLQAVPFGLTGAYSLKLFFEQPHHIYHYVIWGAALVSAVLAARVAMLKEGDYLGEKELRKLQKPKPQPPALPQ